jgi:hypothetical protein
MLFTVFVVLSLSTLFTGLVNVSAQTHGKALILSSLDKYVPMGYKSEIEHLLASAGYNVTIVKDTDVTLNFLTTQLNNYDLIIWRTNIYQWAHQTYWYVGELSNSATLQAYAADLTAGRMDNTNGILGVKDDFFRFHLPSGSLSNVKLMMLVASSSISIAISLSHAGVHSVIEYYDTFSLSFPMIDYTTWLMVRFLASGSSVKEAVYNTMNIFQEARVRDPLDAQYIPLIWYMGDSTLAIKLGG